MGPAQVSAGRGARLARALALAAALLCLSSAASAHFQDFMARIVHVVPRGDALEAYVQMPLALVLLPHDWKVGGGQVVPHFLLGDADGRLAVDVPALHRDQALLAERLRTALRLDGGYGSLVGARIDTLAERDPFTYLPAVERSVGPGLVLGEATQLDLADAVVSMHLRFARPGPGAALALSGGSGEWPDLAARAVNIVRLYREDGSVGALQSVGPLDLALDSLSTGPAVDARESPAAPGFVGYIGAGFSHVLAGLDHVLFILILLVGATSPAHFARTSLAFTLGHSITLCAGALGGLGALAWFAPAVEAAIAASIVYAGVRVLTDREQPLLAPAVFCVGLVHGFGFSFALEGVVPALSRSFLGLVVGFNLGIEAGQLALCLAAAPLLYLLRRYWVSHRFSCSHVLVLPCVATASFWLLERGAVLFEALPP